jgi:glycerate dehydrogenase
MKPGAIVINAARGAVVDEQALAEAIINRTISGAAVDVLTNEPPAHDSPLMKIAGQTNVILTPHIAWASQQAMQTLADQLIDNIEAFVSGKSKNRVV